MMRPARGQAQPAALGVVTGLVAECSLEHEQLGAVRIRNDARIRARLPALQPHRILEARLLVQRFQFDTGNRARLPVEFRFDAIRTGIDIANVDADLGAQQNLEPAGCCLAELVVELLQVALEEVRQTAGPSVRAEFLLEKGQIDQVVERRKLKESLATSLRWFCEGRDVSVPGPVRG